MALCALIGRMLMDPGIILMAQGRLFTVGAGLTAHGITLQIPELWRLDGRKIMIAGIISADLALCLPDGNSLVVHGIISTLRLGR